MAHIETVDTKAGKSYRVRYLDGATGRKRSKSFKRAKDARAFRDNVDKNSYIHDADTITFAEAADLWLEACEKYGRNGREKVEAATLRPYKLHARHLKALIGAEKLNTLRRPRCEKLRTGLIDKFSLPYARKIFTSFKSILNHAVTLEKMAASPAAGLVIADSSRDGPAAAETMPTIAEVKLMLATALEKAQSPNKQLRRRWHRYNVLFHVLAYSGMRPGEVLGLPWNNVDFKTNRVSVSQDMDPDGQIGRPKSKAAFRDIPMPAAVMTLLKEWKLQCPKSADNLVFPNWQGKGERLQNIYNRGWRTLQTDCGLIKEGEKLKYPLKAMRHFRASIAISKGANPQSIKKLMGHSSIKITFDIYGHLFEKDIDDMALQAEDIYRELS